MMYVSMLYISTVLLAGGFLTTSSTSEVPYVKYISRKLEKKVFKNTQWSERRINRIEK